MYLQLNTEHFLHESIILSRGFIKGDLLLGS